MIKIRAKNTDQASPIYGAKQQPFEPVAGDPTFYRKELIYPGEFTKRNQDGEVEFSLTVDDLAMDHWVDQFQKMKSAGVEVPLALEHSKNPERRRGTVEDLKKEFNPSRGANSLFIYSRFRDAQAASMAKTSQVSLFTEPTFFDGKDNSYTYPITHVALTDYPVIPALGGWQAMAMALGFSDVQDSSMNPILQKLAQQLGITVTPDMTDDSFMQLVQSCWTAEDPPAGAPATVTATAPAAAPASLGGTDHQALISSDPNAGVPRPQLFPQLQQPVPQRQMAASLAAPMEFAVGEVIKARVARIDALAFSLKITPAERATLVQRFAEDKQRVAFAMSNAQYGDGFEDVMASLAGRGTALSTGERTAAQHGGGDEKVPLIVQDAMNRAKAAAAK